jgi:phosphopantetheinyl transferase
LALSSDCNALAEIEVRAAASGAPLAFFAGRHAEVAISLSHSHGVGFCALADEGVALGCDVERIEPRCPAFLSDYFSEEEQGFVLAQPESHRDTLATLLWSAKESVLKAQTCGLRADLRSVVVRFPDFRAGALEWRPVIACCSGGAKLRGWHRTTGAFVWTVVAIPSPASPPEPLRSPAYGCGERISVLGV